MQSPTDIPYISIAIAVAIATAIAIETLLGGAAAPPITPPATTHGESRLPENMMRRSDQ